MYRIRILLITLVAAFVHAAWSIESTRAQADEIIRYSIWNKTHYAIKLEFYPSNNKEKIAPGVKMSCSSPISHGQYPKVRAEASNGATWVSTIRKPNVEYRIELRIKADGSKGIRIQP